MILTSLFSRGFLLITIAASAGMFAQEMVSRLSSAEEQRSDSARTAQLAWQSAEAFYASNPRVQRMFCRAPGEANPSQVVIARRENEPLTGTGTNCDAPRPDSIPSDRAVAVMTQSPHWTQTEPMQETEYSYIPRDSSASSLADSGANRESSPPTTPVAHAPIDIDSIPESSLIAMADQPTPNADPPRDLTDVAEPDVTDILPPPAINRAGSGASSLPPWQDRSPRPKLEGPGASPDPGALTTGGIAPHSHDLRYIDPEQLIRERAIERGRQRERRLEARRWLGYSPLRPPVQASPFTSGEPRPIVVFVPRPVVVIEELPASER